MSSFIPLLAISLTFIGLTSVVWFLFCRPRRNAPFPPGPRGLPLAGNLLDVPSGKEWLTFAKWGETYGNILSVSILGRRLVTIMGMIGELMGFMNWLVLLPYGTRLRNQRRLVHHELSSHAATNQPQLIIEHETGRLLRRLSVKPEHLSDHIRKTTGAIMLRIIYGYEIQEESDLFLELVERSTHYFALTMTPGKFLANLIRINWTHDDVKQQMAVGNGPISFSSKLLDDGLSSHLHSMYLLTRGQIDPAVYAFFKAMLLFPDVQTTAQAEIDAIVGVDSFQSEDRKRLPYINALVLEVSRWHTVAPLGVPHSSKEDGVQSGYFIPKGALILANIWKMLHDPAVYKNPFDFNPDRFIRTKDREPEADPYEVAFGFGCRMLADSSIFIVCAMVLATFNISKYSENDVVLEPDVGHTAGNMRRENFAACAIKARSEKALSLINGEGFA
ncbi:cytochrome P450 [Armillaria fumosa]|nr:cytochrome P450 [Armillaria fumosa]